MTAPVALPEATRTAGRFGRDPVAPDPGELTALLAGYRSALRVVDRLPLVLTVAAGRGRISGRVHVPRSRLFLRYFLTLHIRRRLAALERDAHGDTALGADRAADLGALAEFQQSLPTVPLRRLVVWFVVSVVLSAIVIANVASALAPEPLEEAGAALRGSLDSIINVAPNGLIDAAGKFDVASGAAAVIVGTLALYLISALPLTSFRLMRMLLNLTPTDERGLRETRALDHVARADGLYEQERRTFTATSLPVPREIPFDLIVQATFMVFPLTLGVSLAVANLAILLEEARNDAFVFSNNVTAAAWLCLVVPLGRLAHLWAIWRRRELDAAGVKPREPFSRDELAGPWRRLFAFLVDLPLALVASMFAVLAFDALGADENLELALWWFVGIPASLALVTVPFMLRRGRRAGQTLGKQLLGIRVICDDRDPLGRRRVVARELLVKAPLWAGPSLALLGLPALVNGIWSIVDRERRALQDRATGTRVVRVPRRSGS